MALSFHQPCEEVPVYSILERLGCRKRAFRFRLGVPEKEDVPNGIEGRLKAFLPGEPYPAGQRVSFTNMRRWKCHLSLCPSQGCCARK